MFADSLREEEINVFQSQADADVLIVTTAIQQVHNSNVIVVGDDTDLLVLMLHYFNSIATDFELSFYRPSSESTIKIQNLSASLHLNVISTILSMHAFSGCDTTSSHCGVGKTRIIKMVEKCPDLMYADLKTFYRIDATPAQLYSAGIRIITKLYDKDSKCSTLESLMSVVRFTSSSLE